MIFAAASKLCMVQNMCTPIDPRKRWTLSHNSFVCLGPEILHTRRKIGQVIELCCARKLCPKTTCTIIWKCTRHATTHVIPICPTIFYHSISNLHVLFCCSLYNFLNGHDGKKQYINCARMALLITPITHIATTHVHNALQLLDWTVVDQC